MLKKFDVSFVFIGSAEFDDLIKKVAVDSTLLQQLKQHVVQVLQRNQQFQNNKKAEFLL